MSNRRRLSERIREEFENYSRELQTKLERNAGDPAEANEMMILGFRCELLDGALFAVVRLEELGYEVLLEHDEEPDTIGKFRLKTPDPKVETMPEWELLMAVEFAQWAMRERDPVLCVMAGMELTRQFLANGRHDLAELATVGINSLRAGKPRRPRLRTRAILAAFADGRENADAVEGFFRDGGEFEDQWGEISIFPDDDNRDAFGVIDLGARLSTDRKRPTATITKKSIPALIAQTRKKPV